MKFRFRLPFSVVVAIAVGVIVLLGYFLAPAQPDERGTMDALRDYFLQLGVLLAAGAMLVGLLSLVRTHLGKLRSGQTGSWGSMVVLFAMGITFSLGSVDYFMGWMDDPQKSLALYVFRNIQLPVERSLMALLAIILTVTAIRLMHRKPGFATVIFLGTFLIILVGSGLEIPYLSDTVRPWVENIWALAGTRGLLLGISLGVIATGLRILTGIDRPYGG